MTKGAAQALGLLPQGLRQELLDEFDKITRNYREGRWEGAELDAGRFCEIVFTILDGYTSGTYPARANKPPRFDQACRQLESRTTFPESARLSIPRVLVSLYDFRNRRGVGHVGGDVNANHMDATFVLHGAQWVMAELVRLFHDTDTAVAQRVVDTLVDRTLPVVWEINGLRRVLATSLSLPDKTLVLLYGQVGEVSEGELARDLKQSNMGNYRRVLKRLDDSLLVEWTRGARMVAISPLGTAHVEDVILPRTR